jgi:hypothetical protein
MDEQQCRQRRAEVVKHGAGQEERCWRHPVHGPRDWSWRSGRPGICFVCGHGDYSPVVLSGHTWLLEATVADQPVGTADRGFCVRRFARCRPKLNWTCLGFPHGHLYSFSSRSSVNRLLRPDAIFGLSISLLQEPNSVDSLVAAGPISKKTTRRVSPREPRPSVMTSSHSVDRQFPGRSKGPY